MKGHICELAKHEKGSFVLHKIIGKAEPELIRQIATEFEGKILELSLDLYGSKIINSMI